MLMVDGFYCDFNSLILAHTWYAMNSFTREDGNRVVRA